MKAAPVHPRSPSIFAGVDDLIDAALQLTGDARWEGLRLAIRHTTSMKKAAKDCRIVPRSLSIACRCLPRSMAGSRSTGMRRIITRARKRIGV